MHARPPSRGQPLESLASPHHVPRARALKAKCLGRGGQVREDVPLSILLVETNAAARQAVDALLRDYNHTVHVAGSIAEMERVLRSMTMPPDLAFIDFRLRDGPGNLAAARVRARWPEIFVLYSSCLGPDDDEALRLALRAPATALLLKPTSFEKVLQAVRRRPRYATQAR